MCVFYTALSSFYASGDPPPLNSFPTRRSSDLTQIAAALENVLAFPLDDPSEIRDTLDDPGAIDLIRHFAAELNGRPRSEEHTSELQSHSDLVCRLLLEKKDVGARVEQLGLDTD